MSEAKTCLQCGRKLPKSNTQKDGRIKTRSMTIGIIDPEITYCTLRCAAEYGVRVARAIRAANQDGSKK